VYLGWLCGRQCWCRYRLGVEVDGAVVAYDGGASDHGSAVDDGASAYCDVVFHAHIALFE
jgi:hypothetical protein